MKTLRIVELEDFDRASYASIGMELYNSLKSPYCSKIEFFDDGSVFLRLRAERKDINSIPLFVIGIYENKDEIIIIKALGDFSMEESSIAGKSFSSIYEIFSFLLYSLIKNDPEFLSLMEKEAEAMEEKILEGIDSNFFPLLTKRKRIVSKFEAFYLDMLSILDEIEETKGPEKRVLEQKLSRLQVYAERISSNISEIRSEGESLQLDRENKTMEFLTVITTIFLPLSLLTGWYGMNWKGMKELDWEWGYIAFIAVAIVVVALELSFFIKRGFFSKKRKGKGDKK